MGSPALLSWLEMVKHWSAEQRLSREHMRTSLHKHANRAHARREIFFADERVVPLDHEDSNFRANDEALFSKVPIPREHIHTIDVSQLDNPEEVADEYEKQMIATFVGSNAIAFPRFDLILLGIG